MWFGGLCRAKIFACEGLIPTLWVALFGTHFFASTAHFNYQRCIQRDFSTQCMRIHDEISTARISSLVSLQPLEFSTACACTWLRRFSRLSDTTSLNLCSPGNGKHQPSALPQAG